MSNAAVFKALNIGSAVTGLKDGIEFTGLVVKMWDERSPRKLEAAAYHFRVALDSPIMIWETMRSEISITLWEGEYNEDSIKAVR